MDDKVVVITGASGGIGSTIAPLLAAAGAQVVLAARRQAVLEQVAAACRGAHTPLVIPTDVTDPAQVEALMNTTRDRFGRIDSLLNCAGVGILKAAQSITPSDLDTLLDVNLKGSFYASQYAAAIMREQKSGHIINFPGVLGKHPMAMAAGYCASKFGVVGFTKCMADELKRFGVRFTLMFLGGVDSPFWDTVSLKVQRDKMIDLTSVGTMLLNVLVLPPSIVPAEINLQPESHQFLG